MERPGRDLQERTFRFARGIARCCRSLPNDFIGWELGKQLLRSGTSIGANYREAKRARSPAEFKAKIGISAAEAAESEYWLDLIVAEELISESEKATKLRKECGELAAIFLSISKNSP